MPEGTHLPAGFHKFPVRPNPTVQSSGGTPATNRIQEELGQRHVGPRSRSSVQQTKNSFIESAGSTPTRHGQSFPHVNRCITAWSRSSSLPSSEWEKKYVSFTSKALKKGQCNYSATKRELLAIVYALKRWEPFLAGTKFSVETDHKAHP